MKRSAIYFLSLALLACFLTTSTMYAPFKDIDLPPEMAKRLTPEQKKQLQKEYEEFKKEDFDESEPDEDQSLKAAKGHFETILAAGSVIALISAIVLFFVDNESFWKIVKFAPEKAAFFALNHAHRFSWFPDIIGYVQNSPQIMRILQKIGGAAAMSIVGLLIKKFKGGTPPQQEEFDPQVMQMKQQTRGHEPFRGQRPSLMEAIIIMDKGGSLPTISEKDKEVLTKARNALIESADKILHHFEGKNLPKEKQSSPDHELEQLLKQLS